MKEEMRLRIEEALVIQHEKIKENIKMEDWLHDTDATPESIERLMKMYQDDLFWTNEAIKYIKK